MTKISLDTSKGYALEMDKKDPLASYREQFHLPKDPSGKDTIYFCGNSLGLQPKKAQSYLLQELEDWKKLGVEGHFHAKFPWMPYHEFLTASTARIMGAKTEEVVVMNSLTVNLHLMMVSFYRPTSKRFKIVIERDAFPSDRYAVESQLKFHGYDPSEALILLESKSGHPVISTEEILELIEEEGDSIALVMLGGVNYYTGQAFELDKITQKGHEKGCVVGFDLAHGAGNLELKLHDWGVDFAVWCSYKYLNAGPGAVAGCFVHDKHAQNSELPRFAGWWGHEKETRFKMPDNFIPIPSAEGWQLSNAPIFSMSALRASMEIFDEVGMGALNRKSRKLTGYFYDLLMAKMGGQKIEIITPKEPELRGCQLSIRTFENGKELFDRLTNQGVICDWREPDVIRCAPVPLYNSFEDVWRFVNILCE